MGINLSEHGWDETEENPLPEPTRTFDGQRFYDVKAVAQILDVAPTHIVRLTVAEKISYDKDASQRVKRFMYNADIVKQLRNDFSDDWCAPEKLSDTPPERASLEQITQLNAVNSWSLTNLNVIPVTKSTNNRQRQGAPSRFVCPFCGSWDMSCHDANANDITRWKCDCLFKPKNNVDMLAAYWALDPRKDSDEIYRRAAEKLPWIKEARSTADVLNHQAESKPVNTGIFANDKKDEPSDDEINRQILSDIKVARAHLADLPENDRRNIPIEFYKKYRCGFIVDWTHPKMPYMKPTPRIIIPLSDEDQPFYNAILTNSGRVKFKWYTDNGKKEGEKSLTVGGKKIFNPAALNEQMFILFEGEIDALSAMFATDEKFSACALGGTSGAREDLKKRLLAQKHKPKVLVMFDGDKPGHERAKEIVTLLTDNGIAAVAKFYDDFMPDDDKKLFFKKDEHGNIVYDDEGKPVIKLDANDILDKLGKKYLGSLTLKIFVDTAEEIDTVAEIVTEQFKTRQQQQAAKKSSPDRHSPDIKKLCDDLREQITDSELVNAGYLTHSERGSKAPDGYCCPWCNSGTGTHKSGALKYYPSSGVLKCHACGRYAKDVIDFIAECEHLPTDGAEFLETLKFIVDKFSISHDPKIFERLYKRRNVFDENKRVDETRDPKIVEWETVNGKINPQVLPEINGAEKFLDGLTIDNFTSEIAQSSKTIRAVALCKFYDFNVAAADKFFTLVEEARDAARTAVKTAKDNSGFVAEPSDDIKILARLSLTDIRNEIKPMIADLRKAHTKFQAHVRHEEARAREQAKIDAREVSKGYELTKEQADYIFSLDNTEYSNAERFLKLFGKFIRFNLNDEQWFRFNKAKGIWEAGGRRSNVILQPFVKQTAEILMQNAPNPIDNPDSVEIITGWKSLKKSQIAINYLKGTSSIIIKPSDLDRHKNLLNCRNGVLDLQTGKFYETKAVDPAWLITKQCNAIWRGENFILDVVENFFETLIPDEETRRALISWFGYCLTGNVDQQIVHFWKGSGANGKSTLINFILDLFGSYGAKIPTAAILEQHNPSSADAATNALNPIEGARIAIFNELKRNDRLNGPLLKDLSGGDKLNLRPLFMNMREIYPTAKIVINGNYFPKADNINDDGLLRRIRTVEFTQVFKADEDPLSPNNRALQKPDIHLVEKLATPEALSALLARLVAAARAYYETGTVLVSKAMTKSREGYISDNDFLAEFVNEHCITNNGQPKDGAFTPGKDFISALRLEFGRECSQYNDKELRDLFQKRYPQFEYRQYSRAKVKSFIGIGLIDANANIAEANRNGNKNDDDWRAEHYVPPSRNED